MRVLVTGADGQLGRALRETTGGDGWIFTDLAELDITDAGAVEEFFAHERPEMVVNCAAWTDVDSAETEREAAYRVNAEAPRFLAAASAKNGAALIHVSTDFVFDGMTDRPYNEDDVPAPINVYGESKLAGERAVLESGCRGAVVRTAWLYSPWGKNFVKAILGAAAGRDEIRVVADQSGCPTSALSLARAIGAMIPRLKDGPGRGAEIYHFCDAGVVSRAEFAAEIIGQAGLKCRVVPVTSEEYELLNVSKNPPSVFRPAAARPKYSALDTTKFTRTFGLTPRPWAEPLAECINDIENGR